MRTGGESALPLGGEHQDHDGGGEDGEAHARGQGQQGQDAEGGVHRAAGAPLIPLGQGRRRKGDEAHGDGVDEGGHHVQHIHGVGVLALQGGGGDLGEPQAGLQAAQDDLGVDHGDDAHGAVAESNGHADGQDPPQEVAAAPGHIVRGGIVPVAEEVEDQEDHGEDGAHRHAEDGAGGHILHAVTAGGGELGGVPGLLGLFQDVPGERQAHAQLAQGLQHLGDRGGAHVPLALGVAPHTGEEAHAEDRRGQGPDGSRRHGVALEVREALGPEEHQAGADEPQREEEPDGGAEDLALLILPAPGVGLAGELGDGQGQARGGDGEKDVVDLVGGLEVGLAHVPQDVVEGQLIERADDLHHRHGSGQDGRAPQEGLLLALFRHGITSIIRKFPRRGVTSPSGGGPPPGRRGPGPALPGRR